ncbi:hypothetical protein EU95_0437 [Prochlorococcus marinus str. MIT 9201]|uniref:Uncharacterized protein n=1 Tax=Prochlorococcus marinus str. MIT 9201 TaxID=93057 RepID=A0A0A2A3W7_PROMR|nr:hypothetical protein EU95_0437 [Prochlorococcus marinus str. MIT 9201]
MFLFSIFILIVASERLINSPIAVTQDKKIKGFSGISEKFI